MLKAPLIVLIFSSLLSACSQANNRSLPPAKALAASDGPVVHKLYQHYNEWRGVQYREGGLSRKGVDCSGFVHLAFKKRFNKRIPRSTELLSKGGKVVGQQALRPGDLVFFKTGWKKRHVGIYVGKGQFMHASSSRGVMMSKLNNPYWSDAFWMARRF